MQPEMIARQQCRGIGRFGLYVLHVVAAQTLPCVAAAQDEPQFPSPTCLISPAKPICKLSSGEVHSAQTKLVDSSDRAVAMAIPALKTAALSRPWLRDDVSSSQYVAACTAVMADLLEGRFAFTPTPVVASEQVGGRAFVDEYRAQFDDCPKKPVDPRVGHAPPRRFSNNGGVWLYKTTEGHVLRLFDLPSDSQHIVYSLRCEPGAQFALPSFGRSTQGDSIRTTAVSLVSNREERLYALELGEVRGLADPDKTSPYGNSLSSTLQWVPGNERTSDLPRRFLAVFETGSRKQNRAEAAPLARLIEPCVWKLAE